MRLVFILRHLAERGESTTSPVDSETILDLAGRKHDIYLFVDELSPNLKALREAGVHVEVAPNRKVDMGRWITSDQAVAIRVGNLHSKMAVDAVVLSPEVGTDPAWWVPELSPVPLGVTVGDPIHQLSRLVIDDPEMRQKHLLGQWAAAGTLRCADFLVGGSRPDDFGISIGSEPPLLTLGMEPRLSDPPDSTAGSLVVVATTVDRSGLSHVLEDAWRIVRTDNFTTTTVIVPDMTLQGDEVAGDLVLANLDKDERNRVIVVAASDDGVARAFMDNADVVAVEGPAELGSPAVVELSYRKPVVHVSGEPVASISIEAGIPRRMPDNRNRLVIGGTPSDWIASLVNSGADVTILHEGEGADLARRLFETPRLSSECITVICRPGPIHGGVDPAHLSPFAIAIGREVAGAVAYALEHAETIWDLLCIVMSPRNANHLPIRALPADLSADTRPLTGPPADVRLFGRGPLVVRGDVTTPPVTVRKEQPRNDIKAWLRNRKWSDRARLALPWRFGILARAMRGRW